ncbi:uncharacterized protein LOC129598412 [Paramacrobiotus metropolitanus]|uniref:uncharacterized protein LOC129598412 n=1 Tax=Paramacrobiotus metropolitanus TaxID=2943436 RepID=UPI002445F68E|nr:uncharacterized protein LOC129598412 [Paramacrobiotus metropolitanus]
MPYSIWACRDPRASSRTAGTLRYALQSFFPLFQNTGITEQGDPIWPVSRKHGGSCDVEIQVYGFCLRMYNLYSRRSGFSYRAQGSTKCEEETCKHYLGNHRLINYMDILGRQVDIQRSAPASGSIEGVNTTQAPVTINNSAAANSYTPHSRGAVQHDGRSFGQSITGAPEVRGNTGNGMQLARMQQPGVQHGLNPQNAGFSGGRQSIGLQGSRSRPSAPYGYPPGGSFGQSPLQGARGGGRGARRQSLGMFRSPASSTPAHEMS